MTVIVGVSLGGGSGGVTVIGEVGDGISVSDGNRVAVRRGVAVRIGARVLVGITTICVGIAEGRLIPHALSRHRLIAADATRVKGKRKKVRTTLNASTVQKSCGELNSNRRFSQARATMPK